MNPSPPQVSALGLPNVPSKSTVKVPLGYLEEVAPLQPDWLPEGWVITLVSYASRAATGKKDPMYYHTGTGTKVRSRRQLFLQQAEFRKSKSGGAAGSLVRDACCYIN